MEFKGTKGEWYVINNIVTSQEQDICTVDIYLEAYMDIENAKQEIICKANAQLIATAPKLLEALKDMMFIFESLTDKLPTHYSEFNCYKQAKEVINQATKID
jgi:hypothetical protein